VRQKLIVWPRRRTTDSLVSEKVHLVVLFCTSVNITFSTHLETLWTHPEVWVCGLVGVQKPLFAYLSKEKIFIQSKVRAKTFQPTKMHVSQEIS